MNKMNVLAEVVVKGILVAFQNGKLHALVGPETVERGKALRGHRVLNANLGVSCNQL